MQNSSIKTLLLTAGCAFLALTSYANWTGATITADWLFPDAVTVIETHNVVVGPGVELPPATILNDYKFGIDLGDDYVRFDFLEPSDWYSNMDGWRFTQPSALPDITGYSIVSYYGVTGLDPQDLSFTADSVQANFGDSGPSGHVVAVPGAYILMHVEQVPEPSTFALVGLGAGVLATFRRRTLRR